MHAAESELTQKLPHVYSVYSRSLNADQSTKPPVFLGGIRVLISELHTTNEANITNASARIVHANPTAGSSCLTTEGNTSPPVVLPHAAMPMASMRRRLK